MNVSGYLDLLVVSIRARVIVWPRNPRGELIVDCPASDVRIQIARVKMVRLPDGAQVADTTAEIHVIAGHQETLAPVVEPHDRIAILRGEAVACVDGEQPQFIEIAGIEPREDRVRGSTRRSVPRHDLKHRLLIRMPLIVKEPGQFAESSDRPVVRRGYDRALQEDLDGTHIQFP